MLTIEEVKQYLHLDSDAEGDYLRILILLAGEMCENYTRLALSLIHIQMCIRDRVIRLAQRGRKPKPTAVKQLEGNPGKRQLNANEPKPAARAPSCPKWLEDDAKKEWRRLAKQMEQLGILTEVDMAAFAGYCQAYARWKEAEEFISRHGAIAVSYTHLDVYKRQGRRIH